MSIEGNIPLTRILTCIKFKVDFADGDTRNPINFPTSEKWRITIVACVFALFAGMFFDSATSHRILRIGPGAAASTFNTGFTSTTRDLHCTCY